MCFYFFDSFIFSWMIIALQYWVGVCNTSTWISHRYMVCPHVLESLSHFPLHPIPLGSHRTWGLSSQHHTGNSHWLSIWHVILYMFPCYSLHLNVSLSSKMEMNDFSMHSVFLKNCNFFLLYAMYSIYISMLISTPNPYLSFPHSTEACHLGVWRSEGSGFYLTACHLASCLL